MAMTPLHVPTGTTIEFLGQTTPARVFRQRCREWDAQPALRHKRRGLWQSLSWRDYYAQARALALALRALGLEPGQGLCVLAENRPEWLLLDMAAQCSRLVGNGIYPTSSAAQVQHILADSLARVLVVENQEQLDKALAVREQCPLLQRIVVIEREGLRGLSDPGVMFYDELLAQGLALAQDSAQQAWFEASIDATSPDELAFLVYTSGTTGAPKGAMISNRNVVFQMSLAPSYIQVPAQARSLSFLPLCHIAERMASVYNPLAVGLVVHFPENSGTVFNDLREVAPHLIFAPPRFWEKMYSQIELFMRDAIGPARWVWRTAQRWSEPAVRARLAGQPAPRSGLLTRLLQTLALRNVRIFLGLHQLRTALTGAAPVPPDLVRWYLGIGVELREAFGMTETCGFCTATPAGRLKLGWAGVAAAGTELRIGEGDEVLVRGPNVFVGYWGQPEKTAEAIDAEGWLHTGDCGAIDEEGYLSIRDRLKDILITSGGKNITPTQIESQLKFSPYITDAVVIGDGRRYLTALVMLDHEHVARFAQDQQVPYTDYASLTRTAPVRQLIGAEIERINAQLARVEQIKDFRIIAELLTAEDEELTPTMKLKRKVVARRYAALIEEMYASP